MPVPERDHPLARGRLAERANDWLGTAWERGWLKRPALDADTLWSIAARPFGPRAQDAEIGGRRPEDVADFRERLERLCTAIEEEADLNAPGRAMAHGQLVRVIRNRLALGALWTDRPQLLATQLARPIIVIGHMRSGTTRIHKLLAADPAHSFTRYCDAYHPVPQSFGANRAKSAIDLAMLGALNPWLQTIHPMAAGEVEEELAWISASLHHSIYESQWHIPSYSAFSEARCPEAIYREFARLLRTDAAHRGNGERPRVMKVPGFAEDLDTLLTQFPDARVVVSERCREAVLRSAVSLVANQMAIQSDTSDLVRITAQWKHKLDLREERIESALETWNGPVARLQFDALNADWEHELRRIYTELGLDLTDQALIAMRALMADSESGQHRAHSEQLKRFAAQG
jgi:hypothetical protein